MEMPLLDLAVVVATWYAGVGPSVLTLVLACGFFTFFFTAPLYSFEVASVDLPYFFVFAVWSIVAAGFVTVRRRIEDELRQARDRLQVEIDLSRHRENEILRLNQELADRARELEASNEELESFSYSVSHDLRAPLRHVVGFSELLQKRVSSLLDEKSRGYTQTILESAKRMGILIDDLLAFSRIGRLETQKTLVNVAQLVKEVVADVGQETQGREIAWKVNALPTVTGTVQC
jgi:K+-sensing histidine kinase KdpD